MARTQRTDLTQRADALLDAAAELLLATGSRRIRIEEVAARAGVGKGTVYLHWGSRDHLLLAVGAREAAAMLDLVVAAVREDPAEAAPHRYLRRHFLEAMRRPVLTTIFSADVSELDAFARHPARAGLRASKPIGSRAYLSALADHGLLRAHTDLADVEYGIQAVAYGFFTSDPLQATDPSRSLEHRADRLADVIRRSFEPSETPAPDRYAAAAPHVIEAFTGVAGEYRRVAYGTAAD
ncbi:TetR/AcrR family transcriptional regulator [Glycomyces sp. TRM65418]|uniref:TetR/AcrR family transcriptional regulator n=1 Tax=Glycomyces sp. TRM65418 TaxID=2867006 RepID=UPI001CE676DD|nr:TetR/AcrR family transcriptional regulator [Glycomyces sp. TRM65418]MCC3765066.1 TetR/AcrR family transcriptional regulator [Glycomyces sp. TRM65418]QZD54695.1 TetR/AcrR family transcriptional regulator [Glycomyces sp. TRM65418]